MKRIITIIQFLMLVLLALPISAQIKSKFIENPNLPDKIDGYRKTTKSEIGMPGQKLSLNIMEISAYNEKLEKLDVNELMQKIRQGRVGMTPYVNDKMEVKVLVLTELPETEKEITNKEEIKTFSQSSNLIGKAMPELDNFIDINGKNWTKEDLKEKIVVINFWFKECKPCIAEMPELNKLVEQYKDKNVVFIAFAINKREDIMKFLEQNAFNYVQIADAESIRDKFNVNQFPFHAVVDKKGIIQFTSTGLSSQTVSIIEESIKRYLH